MIVAARPARKRGRHFPSRLFLLRLFGPTRGAVELDQRAHHQPREIVLRAEAALGALVSLEQRLLRILEVAQVRVPEAEPVEQRRVHLGRSRRAGQ